jgi:hypothetical protein
MNVSIVLDFEFFDAFSEMGSFFEHQFKPLRLVLTNRTYCADEAAERPTDGTLASSGGGVDAATLVTSGMWTHCSISDSSLKDSIYCDRLNPFNATFNFLPDYKWAWSLLPSTPASGPGALLDASSPFCFKDRVLFAGESHMRFLFDRIAADLSHANATDTILGSKHGDVPVGLYGNIEYHQSRFTLGLRNALEKFCTRALTNANNITEHFINNPKAGPALVALLQSFISRGCARRMRLVVVDMPPYPYCQPFAPSWYGCSEKRYARNNYAMQAANYWLEAELRKIAYPQLQIVSGPVSGPTIRRRIGAWRRGGSARCGIGSCLGR